MAWMTQSQIDGKLEYATTKKTLSALGLTGIRRFFGMNGQVLTLDEITARLQRIDPGEAAETTASLVGQKIAIVTPLVAFDDGAGPHILPVVEYQLTEVINPATGEKRYRMRGYVDED